MEMEEVNRSGPQLEDVEDLTHRIQSLLHVKEANNQTTANHLLNDSGYMEMEEVNRIGPQLEDVTDLVHHIQSLLPVEEAARTCVLSKSWLHAWSTIPTLRFSNEEQEMELIDRTVVKYHQDNIPIETFDLEFTIDDQDSASLAKKWIRIVASQTCLKMLSLKLRNDTSRKFIVPDEIFSAKNIYSIVIEVVDSWEFVALSMTKNSVINCVSLRVLDLDNVYTSDKVLDRLFSTCTLLEKINLSYLSNFHVIKVKNLRHLHKLTMNLRDFVAIHDFNTVSSVINCVALKVLELTCVEIKDEVLDGLFSTCTLLEKIKLSNCRGLKKLKVKNLRYLQEFRYEPGYEILEVDDVPNLRIFRYDDSYTHPRMLNIIDSLRRVTELILRGEIIDVVFFDMINSKLSFLEILNLKFESSSMEKLDIKSVSLKKLRLELYKENRQIEVRVYAPKLLHLFYSGPTIPNLLFPNHTPPKEIQLRLVLSKPMDNSFFYKMREVLTLSCNFDIEIVDGWYDDHLVPVDMDIDDLKTRYPFPATNVHLLVFDTKGHDVLVPHSYFDALFTICHPNYIEIVSSSEDHNSPLLKLITNGLENQKTSDLKSIEFKNPCNEKWEILLTDSCTDIFDESDDGNNYTFKLKLNWCSN